MMRILRILPAVILCLAILPVYSQTVEVEKTYEISGKSKRGFLSGVDYDGKTYQLTYITKQTERKLQTEWYKFDNDFNFLETGEEELPFEKMKTKYTWFRFRDLNYHVEGVSAENNLTGTLVLKRKKISFTYSFWVAGYIRKVELLEKLKPKSDEDAKLTMIASAEDDKTGDILLIAKPKLMGKKAATLERPHDLLVMRFNNKLDLVSQTTVPFDHPQHLIALRRINAIDTEDPENPPIESVVCIFANTNKGMYTDYTYLRLSADTKIKHRQSIKSNSSQWKVDEFIHDSSKDDIYVFGPCVEGTDKSPMGAATAEKFKALQALKINAAGSVEYLTYTDLSEISTKLKTPPSQKKTPEYQGKKFDFANYYITDKGNLFIAGQNYRIDMAGKDAGTKSYLDAIGFYFDPKGNLKAQYGVDVKESGIEAKKNGTPQSIVENNAGSLFWILREIKDYNTIHNKLLTYPRVAKITPDAGIGDFITLGKSEGYYLDPKYPYLQTEKGNRMAFFGANKSGKTLWFCRVKLE